MTDWWFLWQVVAELDTVTSTGRNMFVRFKTDNSNGGINNGQYDRRQGFFAEWTSIHDGQACDHDFGVLQNTGLVGHNNEILSLALPECQAACWYVQMLVCFVYTCRRLLDLSLLCIYMPAIDRSLYALYIHAGD